MLMTARHRDEAAAKFAAEHPAEVARLEAAGIDWRGLLGKFMPILLAILASMLHPAPPPA